MNLVGITMFVLFLLGILLGIFINFGAQGVYDVPLNTDSRVFAGEGETCITPSLEVNCAEGLECTLISTEPYKNGICLPEGSEFEEDFVNRRASSEEKLS